MSPCCWSVLIFVFNDYALLCCIPLALAHRYVAADGMLQIMNVNLRDEGAYTCVARTSLDKDNATALLTVLGESGALHKNEYVTKIKEYFTLEVHCQTKNSRKKLMSK